MRHRNWSVERLQSGARRGRGAFHPLKVRHSPKGWRVQAIMAGNGNSAGRNRTFDALVKRYEDCTWKCQGCSSNSDHIQIFDVEYVDHIDSHVCEYVWITPPSPLQYFLSTLHAPAAMTSRHTKASPSGVPRTKSQCVSIGCPSKTHLR